jgi:hypothetical protein
MLAVNLKMNCKMDPCNFVSGAVDDIADVLQNTM